MDLSYLELEGQGLGIIMKVTRPLLLGPFYWPVNPNILAASVALHLFLYYLSRVESHLLIAVYSK